MLLKDAVAQDCCGRIIVEGARVNGTAKDGVGAVRRCALLLVSRLIVARCEVCAPKHQKLAWRICCRQRIVIGSRWDHAACIKLATRTRQHVGSSSPLEHAPPNISITRAIIVHGSRVVVGSQRVRAPDVDARAVADGVQRTEVRSCRVHAAWKDRRTQPIVHGGTAVIVWTARVGAASVLAAGIVVCGLCEVVARC